MEINDHKIVLLGDGATGKTTYVKYLLDKNHLSTNNDEKMTTLNQVTVGRQNLEYIPTLGVEVHTVYLKNNKFHCWDTAGQERYSGLKDGYYIQASGALIFHDKLPLNTNWERDFRRICDRDQPIVHVFNKCETLNDQELVALQNQYPEMVFISLKEGINRNAPMEKLMKLLE